jgi:hypothetical protein
MFSIIKDWGIIVKYIISHELLITMLDRGYIQETPNLGLIFHKFGKQK